MRLTCSVVLQIDALQHLLTAEQPGWLGFCHNDLQYGNMLLAAHSTTPNVKSLLPAEDNLTQVQHMQTFLLLLSSTLNYV